MRGARIPPGDFEVTFNGMAHSMTDSRLFCDLSIPDSGFVPYSGQKASDYCIARWRQNDKQTTTVLCEYDPNR